MHKAVYLTTEHLKPAARDKPIERIVFADFLFDPTETADEVWLSHGGRNLIIKHRGMWRAERAKTGTDRLHPREPGAAAQDAPVPDG